MVRVPARCPHGTLWVHAGNMESSRFSRLNLNELAAYFEPFRVPLLFQVVLLSRHPHTLPPHHRLP